MRRAFLLSLALAGCSGERTPGQQAAPDMVVVGEEPAPAEPAGTPAPLSPPPRPAPRPAPAGGGLMPLDRAAIGRELEPGAGCSLDGSGTAGPLLVAVAGDAIVNLGGRIVHLKPAARDLAELFRGGRFVGPSLTVEVEREGEVERVDEVTTWQATLRVQGPEIGFTSFHHRWTCGA